MTVANISLRCRRHNHYEGELIFGPHGASTVREVHGGYDSQEFRVITAT